MAYWQNGRALCLSVSAGHHSVAGADRSRGRGQPDGRSPSQPVHRWWLRQQGAGLSATGVSDSAGQEDRKTGDDACHASRRKLLRPGSTGHPGPREDRVPPPTAESPRWISSRSKTVVRMVALVTFSRLAELRRSLISPSACVLVGSLCLRTPLPVVRSGHRVALSRLRCCRRSSTRRRGSSVSTVPRSCGSTRPRGQAEYNERDGSRTNVSSAFVKEAIDKGVELFGWKERQARSGQRRGSRVTGTGVAVSGYSGGSSGFDGLTILKPDGKLYIHTGVGNLGTESFADTSRAAAEAIDMPWEKVEIVWGDTSRHLPVELIPGRKPDDPRAHTLELGGRSGRQAKAPRDRRARPRWIF